MKILLTAMAIAFGLSTSHLAVQDPVTAVVLQVNGVLIWRLCFLIKSHGVREL